MFQAPPGYPCCDFGSRSTRSFGVQFARPALSRAAHGNGRLCARAHLESKPGRPVRPVARATAASRRAGH